MNNKNQSVMTVGIGLIIIGILFMCIAFSQPKILVTNNTDSNTASSEVVISEHPSDNTVSVTYPLNLNTCTYEELITVEGIGESKANLILEYRDYLGSYTSVEQLKDISGIGEGVYESIAPYFTV